MHCLVGFKENVSPFMVSCNHDAAYLVVTLNLVEKSPIGGSRNSVIAAPIPITE
jgi:hypothetical protein